MMTMNKGATTPAGTASAKISMGVEDLIREVADRFAAAGLTVAAARRIAEALVEAEQQGLASHGLVHAPLYLRRIRAGSVSMAETAAVLVDHAAIAVLDGHHMLGHLAADQAMAMAVDKARAHGIGAVAVRHGFHFGAAGRYAAQAAKAGCLGIAMANTRPLMPAPGGAEAVVGNNPIAIGVPTLQGPPIIMDMATSEGALGRIRVAAAKGEAIPATWAVTADGAPTTDPAEAIKGLLLPSGGAKGFALSFVIDLMCGLLSGGAMGSEVRPLYGDETQPNDCSFLFIALDPALFGEAEAVRRRAEAARERIEGSRRAAGAPAILAPGRRKWANEQRQGEIVEIDRMSLEALRREP
jgi:LDH2 family malate/lactate/ureidoglycolate dehydrogenase